MRVAEPLLRRGVSSFDADAGADDGQAGRRLDVVDDLTRARGLHGDERRAGQHGRGADRRRPRRAVVEDVLQARRPLHRLEAVQQQPGDPPAAVVDPQQHRRGNVRDRERVEAQRGQGLVQRDVIVQPDVGRRGCDDELLEAEDRVGVAAGVEPEGGEQLVGVAERRRREVGPGDHDAGCRRWARRDGADDEVVLGQRLEVGGDRGGDAVRLRAVDAWSQQCGDGHAGVGHGALHGRGVRSPAHRRSDEAVADAGRRAGRRVGAHDVERELVLVLLEQCFDPLHLEVHQQVVVEEVARRRALRIEADDVPGQRPGIEDILHVESQQVLVRHGLERGGAELESLRDVTVDRHLVRRGVPVEAGRRRRTADALLVPLGDVVPDADLPPLVGVEQHDAVLLRAVPRRVPSVEQVVARRLAASAASTADVVVKQLLTMPTWSVGIGASCTPVHGPLSPASGR